MASTDPDTASQLYCCFPVKPDECPIHDARYWRALWAERQVPALAFHKMLEAYRAGALTDDLVDNLEAAAEDLDLAGTLMGHRGSVELTDRGEAVVKASDLSRWPGWEQLEELGMVPPGTAESRRRSGE
jgi:hypothetical protein